MEEYFGTRLTGKYKEEKEFKREINKANKRAGAMNHLIRTKELSRTEKFDMYKAIIRPTVLYDFVNVGFEPEYSGDNKKTGTENN